MAEAIVKVRGARFFDATVQVNKAQMKKILNKLEGLRSKKILDKAFRLSSQIVVDSVRENFKRQGRPRKWQKWSPIYRKKVREKIKFPFIILELVGRLKRERNIMTSSGKSKKRREARIFKGELKKSINKNNVTIRHNGFIVSSNVAYAQVQHFGGRIGKGNRVRIPARPFMIIQPKDVIAINKTIAATITEQMRK